MTSKQSIRTSMRAKRRALSPRLRSYSSLLAARKFCNSFLFLRYKRIAVYLANDGEIDPGPIYREMWKRHKQCYLPVVHGPAFNRMWFARFGARSKMKPNRYGISEPVVSMREMTRGSNLDLVLVPLVAFDKQGNRLGMGGGYYDRTFNYLKRRKIWKKPLLVGFAYDMQEAPQMSTDVWDIPLNYIATETRLIRL